MWESEVGEAGVKQSLPAVKVVTLGRSPGTRRTVEGKVAPSMGKDQLAACLSGVFIFYLFICLFFNTCLSFKND